MPSKGRQGVGFQAERTRKAMRSEGLGHKVGGVENDEEGERGRERHIRTLP